MVWVSQTYWGRAGDCRRAVSSLAIWVASKVCGAGVSPFLRPLGPPRCLLSQAHGFFKGRHIPDTELPTVTVIAHLCPKLRPRASDERLLSLPLGPQ